MRERAADRGAFSLKNGDPSARAERQVMRLCLSARQDHRFLANGCLMSAARSLISDWVFDDRWGWGEMLFYALSDFTLHKTSSVLGF